jgi:hypothetical protein
MNTRYYRGKMNELLNEPTYNLLQDPTNWVERKTAALIRESDITGDVTKKLVPSASVPPRLYSLPKIHKEKVPLCPVVNCIGSPTYLLAQHIIRDVGLLVGLSEHHIKISASFIQKLRAIGLQITNTLVSFDVVSLFTKAPMNDTLQLLE